MNPIPRGMTIIASWTDVDMTESVDLDRMTKEVHDAAEQCGSMILESILASEHLPAVAVDGETFPGLVRHLKPRLIYMVLAAFDAKEEVVFHSEEDELDPGLKKLAAKWTNRKWSVIAADPRFDG